MAYEYRVVRRRYKNRFSYGIYETCTIDGIMRSIADLPKAVYGENLDELKVDIQKMISAYKKPVIDYETMKEV